jgi:hypothetical protein
MKTRQYATCLLLACAILSAPDRASGQPAQPRRPAPPAPPTPPAVAAPPALPFYVDDPGDLDFDFDVDVDVAAPPVPPLPPSAPIPMHPLPSFAFDLAQDTRVVVRSNASRSRARSRVEALYEQALNSIDRGQLERAIEQLDDLIQQFENQSGTTAVANKVDGALYWKAYSQVKQKQIAEALATIDVMQKKFSASRWLKDAKALEVEARQAGGQSVSPDAQAGEELKLLALRGIMQSDPDRGVPMIEQLLAGNSSVKVKENALFVLSQSRSARARDIITNVAKGSGNPDLQLRAVRYLGAIGGPENRQILEDVYRSTNDLAVKRAVIRSFAPSGDRARLLSIARSESSEPLRGEAIQQLGAMRATAELSELYGSERSPEIRRRIIQSLMVSGASDKLVELAKTEKDEELRTAAVRNLGVMNANRTGEILRSLYSSEADVDVKKEIIGALFVQRNASALVELARTEKDIAMKKEIVSRLSNMRDKIATDYMLELLK